MKKTISLILILCIVASLFSGVFTVSAATTSTGSKTVQLVLNSEGTAFKVPDGVTVYVGDTIKFDTNAELLINGTPTKLSSLNKINVHYDRAGVPIKMQYYTTDPGRPTYLETLKYGEFVVDIAGNYYSQVQWWIEEEYYEYTYFEKFTAVERPDSSKVIDMVLNENGTAFKIPNGVTVNVGDTVRFDPEAELLINGTPTKLSSLDKINVHYEEITHSTPIIYQYFTTNSERATYLPSLKEDGSFPITGQGKYYSQAQWWIEEEYFDYTFFEPFVVTSDAFTTTSVTSDGFEYTNYGSFCKITGYYGNATSVTVPSKINGVFVFEIDKYCFMNTSVSQDVIISDGIRNIGSGAFYATKIKKISIPKTVLKIEYDALGLCSQLEEITVEDGNIIYNSSGNCIIETKSKTLVHGCKKSVIPNDSSVTNIGEFAFFGSGITEISIPNTVTDIESNAFYYCTSLTQLTVADSVKNIGANAFAASSNLEIEIHDSVTTIGKNAFSGVKKVLCYENSTVSRWADQNDVDYETITPLYGDVNSNKSIDIFDLIVLAKHIVNPSSVVNTRTADVSMNDSIDIFDLIGLAKYIVSAKNT